MGKIFDIMTGKEYVYTGRPAKLILLSPEGDLYRGDLEKFKEATCRVEQSLHITFFAKYLQNYGNIKECRQFGIKISNNRKIDRNDQKNLDSVYKMLLHKGFIVFGNICYYFQTKDGYISTLELSRYLNKNITKYNKSELKNMRRELQMYKNINNNLDFGMFLPDNFTPTKEQFEMLPLMKTSFGKEIKTGFLSYDIDSSEQDQLEISIEEIFKMLKNKKRTL